MKLATVAAAIALVVVTTAAGPPFSDPPLGNHCACNRGVCPLDANGRRCSCGCSLRVDAQPLKRLDGFLDITCSEGLAGPFPCRDIDLMAFLSHFEIGGGTGNDIWGWTDP